MTVPSRHRDRRPPHTPRPRPGTEALPAEAPGFPSRGELAALAADLLAIGLERASNERTPR